MHAASAADVGSADSPSASLEEQVWHRRFRGCSLHELTRGRDFAAVCGGGGGRHGQCAAAGGRGRPSQLEESRAGTEQRAPRVAALTLRPQSGRSALHAAARGRHLGTVKALVQLKADSNQPDDVRASAHARGREGGRAGARARAGGRAGGRTNGQASRQAADGSGLSPRSAQDGYTPTMAAAGSGSQDVYHAILEAPSRIATRAKVCLSRAPVWSNSGRH
jgi:hypothetical protein